MKEIFYKGSKIFEFEDAKAIQVLGSNTYLINIIKEIYSKLFSSYRFSDLDIEAMDGYYPEVKKDGISLNRKDMTVVLLSDLNDIIEGLSMKKNSILMKNIISLNSELSISELIFRLEELLLRFSIEIDSLLDERLDLNILSLKSDIENVNFESVINTFISLNYCRGNENKVPLWLLKDAELIEVIVNLIRMLIENSENVTVIIDKLDSKISLKDYDILIDKLYQLSEEFHNFNMWLIPSSKEGVYLNYKIFCNTYIINDDIYKLGDFDITYDSICRNYPDENLPSKEEVLYSLLRELPFYDSENYYLLKKEVVIMSIFKKILGEDINIKFEKQNLSVLENKFLTSLS